MPGLVLAARLRNNSEEKKKTKKRKKKNPHWPLYYVQRPMAADALGSSPGFTEGERYPCGGEHLVDVRAGSKVGAGGRTDWRPKKGKRNSSSCNSTASLKAYNLEAAGDQSGPSQFMLCSVLALVLHLH